MGIIAVGIIIVVVLVDQWSKAKAREQLAKGHRIKGPFKCKLVYNEGAFSGWLKKRPLLLKGLGVVATVILLGMWLINMRRQGSRVLTIGLSFLAGGAMGNLYDRLVRGKVTDFFTLKKTARLYYNLADMAIFLGAILVMLSEFRKSSGR